MTLQAVERSQIVYEKGVTPEGQTLAEQLNRLITDQPELALSELTTAINLQASQSELLQTLREVYRRGVDLMIRLPGEDPSDRTSLLGRRMDRFIHYAGRLAATEETTRL